MASEPGLSLTRTDLQAEIATLRAALERISTMSEAYEHDLFSATRHAAETLAAIKQAEGEQPDLDKRNVPKVAPERPSNVSSNASNDLK